MNPNKRWAMANRLDDRGNPCGINIIVGGQEAIVCRMPDGATVEGGKAFPATRAAAQLIVAAPVMAEALRLVDAFLDDLAKSNPGYMGKLCLQDYGQWNQAMLALSAALAAVPKAAINKP